MLLPCCILPDGAFIKIWVTMRFITAIAISLLTPFQQIQTPYTPPLDLLLFSLDFIAYTDLYVMMLVGYYEKDKQLVIHPCKTAAHYFKGLFICDIIFCFPWEMIVWIVMPDHDEGHSYASHLKNPHIFHCVVRMIRILQVYRLPKAFGYLEADITKKGDILEVMKFVPFTIIFINVCACIIIITSCKFFNVDDLGPNAVVGELFEHPGYAEVKLHHYTMFCKEDSWLDR